LTLKVPLLGKVHIRRNIHTPQGPPRTQSSHPSQGPSGPGLWNSQEQVASQIIIPPPTQTSAYAEPTMQAQQDWQWDNFSWSVDNSQDYFFQDALMTDSFDQLGTWQNVDTNFPFSN
jgi:hypothetical protein